MSLNIKNPEAERLATEIGAFTGENKTAAIIVALRERLERLLDQHQQAEDATMADDLLTLAARISARLAGPPLSTDALYDSETGLPA
ncbi:type II toxin-antitoxin system VapB family antitoxin [Crossiella sp. CA198]|uniref:type II toxin-antitoxin system VapB family antitoxin n=1 Tax=Crossiella sp. CA198 TaxID=3455607 RepID=UPI003F8D4743